MRPDKRLVLTSERPVPSSDLERIGEIVSNDEASAVLQVAQHEVQAAVSRALASLPVRDLTVENAPLEEVMSELFARSRAEHAGEAKAS